MQRQIELNEYFDAQISATDHGKVTIEVYAKDGNNEHALHEEHAEGTIEEVEENAQTLINEARNLFDEFSSAINVVDLHMKTACENGAEVNYGLVPPGSHIIEIKGTIKHKEIEDTLVARFEWYWHSGEYTPKLDRFYTKETNIGWTDDEFSETNAKELIKTTIQDWEKQVDKILNNNTDKDKIQDQLSNLS